MDKLEVLFGTYNGPRNDYMTQTEMLFPIGQIPRSEKRAISVTKTLVGKMPETRYGLVLEHIKWENSVEGKGEILINNPADPRITYNPKMNANYGRDVYVVAVPTSAEEIAEQTKTLRLEFGLNVPIKYLLSDYDYLLNARD